MADDIAITPPVDFSKPLDVGALKGQTAIVTGGCSGIGLGISAAMAEAGAYVVIADMNVQSGEAIVADLKAKGFHVNFVATDVTSYDSQLAAFKTAIEFSPNSTIDIVVPCAGISGSSIALGAMPPDLAPDADPPPPPMAVLNIDLYGVYYSTHLAIHYFKKFEAAQGNGPHKRQILFISSLAGYGDQPLTSNYAAAKWGVRGLFKSIRSCGGELGNMRANLLAPTFIRTAMTQSVIDDVLKHGVKVGEVSDAVDGALRCLCDDSVEGRAICIGPGEMNGGPPGSANFDVGDDFAGGDAGKEFVRKMASGLFGDNFASLARYTNKSRENAWSYRK